MRHYNFCYNSVFVGGKVGVHPNQNARVQPAIIHIATFRTSQPLTKMMHKRTLTSLFALLFATLIALPTANAQINAEGSLTFTTGLPRAEFADQLDANGYGANLNFAAGFPGSPLMIGLDGGFMIYGHERRNEPFSLTIPDVTVDVVTDNSLASGHIFLRLKPDLPGIKPYADALFGFKYFFTQTRIESEAFSENEITRSTNFDDTAMSYGFGGGVQINLFTPTGDDGPGGVFLDLGAQYLMGSEASYLQEGSIRRQNGQVTFDVDQSRTDMLLIKVGVGITF